MKNQVVIPLLTLLLASSPAFSATATSEAKVDSSKIKRLSIGAYLGVTSNMYSMSSDSYEASSTLTVVPSYKLDNGYSLGAMISGTKELTDYREESLDAANLSLSKSLTSYGHQEMFRSSLAGKIYLPVNEDIRKETSLVTTTLVQLSTSADMSKVGVKGLGLSHSLSLSKSFHEYETTYSGSINKSYAIVNSFALSFDFSDDVSASTSMSLYENYNYRGKRKEAYVFDLSGTVALNTKSALTVGITTSGATFKANGVDSNIELLDSRESAIYTSLSYQF